MLEQTRKQIDEYFDMKRQEFDIPLIVVGATFQKSVWSPLLKAPYDTTSIYLQSAKDISNAKVTRAVVNANGANAIAIIIPCHCIGSNEGLTGFGGELPLKKRLLELENNLFIRHYQSSYYA